MKKIITIITVLVLILTIPCYAETSGEITGDITVLQNGINVGRKIISGQNITIKNNVTNSSDTAKDVVFVVALYDSNDGMIEYDYSAETVEAESSAVIQVSISVPKECKYAKLMLWDDLLNAFSYTEVLMFYATDFDIPIRTMGYEYEQTTNTTVDEEYVTPEIESVHVAKINEGMYLIYLTEDDYTCDESAVPFFFWTAREGVFVPLGNSYRAGLFYPDNGTGGRNVKLVVGIGDGRGYVNKKTFLLEGYTEE